jgi:hypothetical protein
MRTFTVLNSLDGSQNLGLYFLSILIGVVLVALARFRPRRRFPKFRIFRSPSLEALPALYLLGFGAVGLLFERPAVALLGGLVPAVVVTFALHKLMPEARPVQGESWLGATARVTMSIPEGGVGRIGAVRDGAQRSLPARAKSGASVRIDTQVWVVGVERGIAQVEEL